MEVARVHDQWGRRYAGFGKQQARRQVQSKQCTLPVAGVRAIPNWKRPLDAKYGRFLERLGSLKTRLR